MCMDIKRHSSNTLHKNPEKKEESQINILIVNYFLRLFRRNVKLLKISKFELSHFNY